MGRALDKCLVTVQEIILTHFKFNAKVRAVVPVDMNPAILLDGKDAALAGHAEPPGFIFWYLFHAAKRVCQFRIFHGQCLIQVKNSGGWLTLALICAYY